MMHTPIQIRNLSLSFTHKVCFDEFSAQINHGDHIAIIGQNGSGKSSLLNILRGATKPTNGVVQYTDDVVIGYVPQVVDAFDTLSGGQRINAALSAALGQHPNMLLLDEPTNHLDRRNRTSLLRMLRSFFDTLIVVTHDTELLRSCIGTIWHIDNGKIHVFSGNYDDYLRERSVKRSSIEKELSQLHRQKDAQHEALMYQQQRASKSKARGEKNIRERKWAPVAAGAIISAGEKFAANQKATIDAKKHRLIEQLAELHLPEIITPTFSLSAADIGDRTLVSITDGTVGYHDKPVLHDISLLVGSRDRIALQGDNASGKSTLIKAMLGDSAVITTGNWTLPKRADIGYLDQHYNTLPIRKTVYESIADLVPAWKPQQVRKHLNDFLFRKNEEVNSLVSTLSGGEKARLSLAMIAAHTPKLLILDEITNNLDLEALGHVTEVLKAYPGAMIVISHDTEFFRKIGIQDWYLVENGTIALAGDSKETQ